MMRFTGLGDDPPGVQFFEIDAEAASLWRLPRRVPIRSEDADLTEADPATIARGIQRLLAHQPGHPDAPALLRFARKQERDLWNAVADARDQRDWRALIRHLEIAIGIDPEDARALSDLAFAYRRTAPARGKQATRLFKLAEQTYRRAIALAPDLPQAQTGLGGLLVETDRPEEALPLLEHSLKVRTDQPSASFYLGRAYGATGDDKRAREHLEAAIAAVPNDPRPRFYLSVALARLGDEAGAATELARAMALNPDLVRAMQAAERGE
ncbi:MAG: tetratricopeptide repeat protein [Dehalococcoidia bacterium]